jgi:hypothetical protein
MGIEFNEKFQKIKYTAEDLCQFLNFSLVGKPLSLGAKTFYILRNNRDPNDLFVCDQEMIDTHIYSVFGIVYE